jgi:hypothetical protein
MIRVRKARRASRLTCGHHVLTGQLIASRDGRTWICINCQLAAIRSERPATEGRAITQGKVKP